jgi:hypothetical protein
VDPVRRTPLQQALLVLANAFFAYQLAMWLDFPKDRLGLTIGNKENEPGLLLDLFLKRWTLPPSLQSELRAQR